MRGAQRPSDEEGPGGGGRAGRCTAFEGYRRIASGDLAVVARKTKAVIARGERAPVLVFDDTSGRQVEIDFRGTTKEVLERLAAGGAREGDGPAAKPGEKRGPGRPKLGVVAREVTLLPRHWAWLNEQPGGASVALRKLVEEARRSSHWKDLARRSQEAVHHFMYCMTGNLPGFEEASRAFYSGDRERFGRLVKPWPKDVREHLKKLVAAADRDAAACRESSRLAGCEPVPTLGSRA